MPRNLPKYICEFIDRHGKVRRYFRYRGKKVPIPYRPGNALFNGNYIHDSLDRGGGVKYIAVINKGVTQMTAEQKKQKILAALASRGWATVDVYWNQACELRDAGLIKLGDRFFTGGNRKPVWVAA
jgi:hypothetical protein